MILFRDDYDEAAAAKKQAERYRRQLEMAKEMTVKSVRRYLLDNLTKEELKTFVESLKD